METLASSPADSRVELHLLTDWEQDRARVREAGVLSAAMHVVVLVVFMLAPRSLMPPPPASETARVTPLIEPLTRLTQRAPNKGKISKEMVAAASPRPHIQIPAGRP